MIADAAVVWGYASGVERHGGEVHPRTEVITIDVTDHQVTGVRTDKGEVIRADCVVNATSGYCTTVSKRVRVDLPVGTHPLQAWVTEPPKPFLDKAVVSANLHVYAYQTDRGDHVMGSLFDRYS